MDYSLKYLNILTGSLKTGEPIFKVFGRYRYRVPGLGNRSQAAGLQEQLDNAPEQKQ